MSSQQEHAYARRWWILLVLCLSLVVITLDNTILNVALPTLVRDLDATNSQLQWMVDSYTLVFAGLLLTAGSLGDRFGRKGALQIGLGDLRARIAALRPGHDAGQLIVTRAIMGIGGAFIMPATLSILTNVFPAEERGRPSASGPASRAIGIALGPLLGGFLIDHFSWDSIFTVNIPIAIARDRRRRLPRPDVEGPVGAQARPGRRAACRSSASSRSSTRSSRRPARAGPTRRSSPASRVGLPSCWSRSSAGSSTATTRCSTSASSRTPASPPRASAITLVFFAMFGFSFLLTQYFQFVLGYDALDDRASACCRSPLTLMVVAPLSSRIVERVGTKVVVGTGLAIVAVALVLCTRPPGRQLLRPGRVADDAPRRSAWA